MMKANYGELVAVCKLHELVGKSPAPNEQWVNFKADEFGVIDFPFTACKLVSAGGKVDLSRPDHAGVWRSALDLAFVFRNPYGKFRVGDRVRLTAEGKATFHKEPDFAGEIEETPRHTLEHGMVYVHKLATLEHKAVPMQFLELDQ